MIIILVEQQRKVFFSAQSVSQLVSAPSNYFDVFLSLSLGSNPKATRVGLL